ncbi:hypothetical protein SCOR_29360 [Sulfidibacter corallicola]|uniref:Uncharacterized protein n=1 Tax=Sulfidibacter corallicola TaxID=2818388 RepID=A0A8A4TUY2_SULCO|nr:hypothetical protein [Sulfidibacter corallicola]QTD50335.1 hypothetical protein J3U87_32525 [Sulfidibacter corallicola]
MVNHPPDHLHRSLTRGEFRRLVLEEAVDFLRDLRLREEAKQGDEFVKREPSPLLRRLTTAQRVAQVRDLLKHLVEDYPHLAPVQETLAPIIAVLADSDRSALLLVDAMNDLMASRARHLPDQVNTGADAFRILADAERVVIQCDPRPSQGDAALRAALDEQAADQRMMAAVTHACDRLRARTLHPTSDEVTAIRTAYALIEKGVPVPSAYQSLGTSGFRAVQTFLSIADPGEGHLNVTVRAEELLAGVAVHVEHIDRDKEADKEKVEPYRLPAPIHAARVRLWVGNRTPVTAFIGRPVFESGTFAFDLLKTAHLHASACSVMFANGIADCKIGIERMKASQAVSFMNALVGNVQRDPERQYLSAAFNINTPIVDDLEPGCDATKPVEDPFELGRLGIRIAVRGGFDKVAWDGASNKIPSDPIIEQLSHAEFVTLIHEAHENGLETYISAGLRPEHMARCVETGVDGVGIGTSLHYRDPVTKLMGELKPAAIREVLTRRDEAAGTLFGRAAKFLARLDRMYFEGILAKADNPTRLELFAALRDRDAETCQKILDAMTCGAKPGTRRVTPSSATHPLVARAARLVAAGDGDIMLKHTHGTHATRELVSAVGSAARRHDLERLRELLC